MEKQKKFQASFDIKAIWAKKVLSLTSLERYKSLRDEYCKPQSYSHELYWIRFYNSKNTSSKMSIFDFSLFATDYNFIVHYLTYWFIYNI